MRLNKGRGWVDMGATGLIESTLPPDVRMPYKTFAQDIVGHVYRAIDKEACHIDTKPTFLGRTPEEDVEDDSRHGGTHHLWQSQGHASEPPYRPGGIPRGVNLLVGVPHVDCSAHLPDERVTFLVPTGKSMRLYWEAESAEAV